MKWLLLFALLPALRLLADDSAVSTLVARGDEEDRLHHTRVALSAFQAAEKLEPGNFAILLRISHEYTELIAETKPPENQRCAQAALDYAQRGLRLDPSNAKAHLCVAVAYGRLTDFVPDKTRVEYSKLVKAEADKSLSIDPADDFAWYLLGRWNLAVANLGGLTKTLANLVYGGLPPASNAEAVRCFQKAAEIAPQRLVHHGALARAYTAVGRSDLARKEWQAVAGLTPSGREEESDKAEARRCLASLR